jgi:hypothetical protein
VILLLAPVFAHQNDIRPLTARRSGHPENGITLESTMVERTKRLDHENKGSHSELVIDSENRRRERKFPLEIDKIKDNVRLVFL